MKKMIAIVLAMVLALGFAGVALAMGPSGADATDVGFVLTTFGVSDSILSPLMTMNWAGTLAPDKTYGEGQPIWFVAKYIQNKWSDDGRNFATVTSAGQYANRNETTTTFTSKDNCVNFSFSQAYMNFTRITNLSVIGGGVKNLSTVSKTLGSANGAVSAEDNKLEVTMVADNADALDDLAVQGIQDGDSARTYYLQLMAFTRACAEAQGTVYAKTPIDAPEFTSILNPIGSDTDISSINAMKAVPVASTDYSILNIYNENSAIKYIVVKYTIDADVAANLVNIGAKTGDNLYMIYDSNGDQIVGFVSSKSAYKGMASWAGSGANAQIWPIQWTADNAGKYAYSAGPGVAGTKAVEAADLKAVMDFFGFSFGNDYPILDKHIQAYAGYWMIKEAKYNVAAAIITGDDPAIDVVPKTGDVASSTGMIMVALALAGLAGVGFVVSKRVRG